MTKKIIFIISLVVIFLVAIFWYFQLSSLPETPSILQDLKIGIKNNVISSLIIVADKQGFFKDEGLNVDIIQYQSGKLAVQALFRNEVDVAATFENVVVNNSLDRADFSIFTEVATTNKGCWITARSDRGIINPIDLVGKTIGTQKDSAVNYFLDMFLLFNNIKKDEVKIVFYDPKDLPKALQMGEIDAFSMNNPYSAEAKQLLGEDKITEFFDDKIYRQYYDLVAMNSYIIDHKEMLSAILKALIKAEAFAKNNPLDAQKQVIEFYGRDQTENIVNTWSDYDFRVKLTQAQLLDLENEYRWKTNDGGDMPNYSDFVDYDILHEIKPEAVTIIH